MWTKEKINDIYQNIQRLAVTDEEFREQLLKDPNAAISKIAGEELPSDYKIKVIENDPKYAATFVLPPMVSDELNDEDLDKVAGGACIIDGCGAEACAADGCLKD